MTGVQTCALPICFPVTIGGMCASGRGVLRVTCCVGRGACSGGGSVVRVVCDVLLGGWWCRSGMCR